MSTAAPALDHDRRRDYAADAVEAEAEAGERVNNKIGRALDAAGIVAGVVLGVILFDIISGGKLTRWARNKRARGYDSGPCEGCQDKDEAPE